MLQPLLLPLRQLILPQQSRHMVNRGLQWQLRLLLSMILHQQLPLLPLMLHQQLQRRQRQQQRPGWVGCSQGLACVCCCPQAALKLCNCPSSSHSSSSSSRPCSSSNSRARFLQQHP
jgi:hypothetical protein